MQPDVVFVAKGNDILTAQGARGAPILWLKSSPEDGASGQKSKRHVYARSGVKELWLIDPDTETIHVYFLQKDAEKPAKVYGARDTFTSPTFPGFEVQRRRHLQAAIKAQIGKSPDVRLRRVLIVFSITRASGLLKRRVSVGFLRAHFLESIC